MKPKINRRDLLILVACAIDTNVFGYNRFLVPEGLERQMARAIGKPFTFCLWWESFENCTIQPHPKGNELLLVDIDYYINLYGFGGTTCK